jgi:hypothetical protein
MPPDRIPQFFAIAITAVAFASSKVDAQPVSLWPAGRVGHVIAYDASRGEVVLLGGDTNAAAQTSDSLWSWNGVSWRVSPPESPSWRTLPGLAFDSRRGRLVYYGGKRKFNRREYGASLDDTWEWDGERWEMRAVNNPGPLDHHAMVYDDARGVIVLYGGVNANVSPNPAEHRFNQATWVYDGTSWRMAADSTAGLGARAHHAMVYDSRRRRVVLFGGTRGEGGGDTWEWDGTRWLRVSTTGPGVRSGLRMAYDAARGVTVLFGGSQDRVTWTWDGQRWTAAAQEGPPPRGLPAMAYDARRQRVVMFGGGNYLSDLWEWDGSRWIERVR